jgi:hypothetical protein
MALASAKMIRPIWGIDLRFASLDISWLAAIRSLAMRSRSSG